MNATEKLEEADIENSLRHERSLGDMQIYLEQFKAQQRAVAEQLIALNREHGNLSLEIHRLSCDIYRYQA